MSERRILDWVRFPIDGTGDLERVSHAHRIGDAWTLGAAERTVMRVCEDGRLEFDDRVREGDRAYFCRDPRDMERLGWKRREATKAGE